MGGSILQEIDHEVRALRLKLEERLHDERRMKEAVNDIRRCRGRLRQIDARRAKLGSEVDATERLTLSESFTTLLGTRADRLDPGRQEHLRLLLQRRIHERLLPLVIADRDTMRERVRARDHLPPDWTRLLDRREARWEETGIRPTGTETLEREGILMAQMREADRAADGGVAVIALLDRVERGLRSVAAWGGTHGVEAPDPLEGVSIDDTPARVIEVQAALVRFRRELLVLRRDDPELDMEVEGLWSFSDDLYAALITDWAVHGRVREALRHVDEVRRHVSDLLTRITAFQDEREAERSRLPPVAHPEEITAAQTTSALAIPR